MMQKMIVVRFIVYLLNGIAVHCNYPCFLSILWYDISMTVKQIVEIPANRRITLEVPQTVPEGKTILTFTPAAESPHIGDVRRLLQKEMAEKGTLAVTAESGDGWEAHVMEKYGES